MRKSVFILPALLLIGAAAAPARAGVFTASVSTESDYFGSPDFPSLPQYSGSGKIVDVKLALTGVTFAVVDEETGDDGYLPPEPVSWVVHLNGPGEPDDGGTVYDLLASQDVTGVLPGGYYAPDSFVELTTVSVPLDIDFDDPRLSIYAGTGTIQFITWGEGVGYDFSGTLTETITTAVPEPATWALMLGGLFGLGAALRRRPETRRTA